MERALRSSLFVVAGLLWLKLAYDLIFDFGPESARDWFPPTAVAAMSAFSVYLFALNAIGLAGQQRPPAETRLTGEKQILITAAFLASLFSCWASENVQKFAQMYVLIPLIVFLVIGARRGVVSRGLRLALLLLSVPLLIPSDLCENPQNWWWIRQLGASPLTYLLPLTVLLHLTGREPRRPLLIALHAAVWPYYLACVYHRLTGGY